MRGSSAHPSAPTGRPAGTPAEAQLDRDALLSEREVGELVPVRRDRVRHLLLVGDDLTRRGRSLLVAGALRDPREQLVARDLHVLGREAVASVPAGLVV